MAADTRGLQESPPKFQVRRTDDSPRHRDCVTFVLDLTHDPAARVAVQAYVDAARTQRPQLTADLQGLLDSLEA